MRNIAGVGSKTDYSNTRGDSTSTTGYEKGDGKKGKGKKGKGKDKDGFEGFRDRHGSAHGSFAGSKVAGPREGFGSIAQGREGFGTMLGREHA